MSDKDKETPLTSLDQLKVGTRLKIIGKSPKDSYGSVSVKKIIECAGQDGRWWTEILINRSRNYYFHLENYLAGKSQWVDKVFVIPGFDARLKAAQLREGGKDDRK